MTPDENKELKELVEFLKENGIDEFEFERGDLKIRIKFGQPGQATAASALDLARLGQLLSPGQNPPTAGSQGIHAVAFRCLGIRRRCGAAEEAETLHIVKSPIVGTFYESSSPGRPGLCQDWRRD